MSADLFSTEKQNTATLPRKVEVLEVVSSRYGSGYHSNRPQSWDKRVSGVDVVRISDGSNLTLASSPMQSVPKAGWVLMLTSGDASRGFEWTLYGMTRRQ